MTVTVTDVQRIRDELTAKGLTPAEVVMGTRTEVHALLQLEQPAPGPEAVTDAHRLEHSRDRSFSASTILGPRGYVTEPAHHWLQKQHGIKLWEQADALCVQAGVK